MTEPITLDGRKFLGISQALTANQDDYILAHLRLSGALAVLRDLDGKTRTEEQRVQELLTQMLLSGRTHQILAGCLTEDGKTWSRAEADANAARFGDITDIAEKTVMRTSIVTFVIGFFSLVEPAAEIFQKSSSRSETVPHTKSAAPSTSGT
jgi:hypothetical protein